MKNLTLLLIGFFFIKIAISQEIPSVYSSIFKDEKGYYVKKDSVKIYETKRNELSLKKMIGTPKADAEGIHFNFENEELNGILYFGLIHYQDSKHPQAVYYHTPARIKKGKALLELNRLRGKYDMIGWEKSKKGTLGYRIVNARGEFLYDGIISFKLVDNKFEIDNTITQGPFINLVTEKSVTISFTTNFKLKAKIKVNGKEYSGKETTKHEILIDKLKPNTQYEYEIDYKGIAQKYSFKTAPKKGSKTEFTFAYASDSRGGVGGGERNVSGANTYIIKKIAALAYKNNASFFQFTGDLISGYTYTEEKLNLEYSNWKRAIQAFGHYMPIYAAMGNHEIIMKVFKDDSHVYLVDNFPFETKSAEQIFANNFTNPTNGLESEDGASYDPDLTKTDFPSYKENVYYYVYDNVAMIVLNSNYFYAPTLKGSTRTSGNLHGYIMNQQMEWLQKTLNKLEKDNKIDHIFVTQHTPAFPNGGHVGDDMWYSGNNEHRAFVAGKPLKKGIIERRDEYLDLLVNKSTKVRAILTGDEHNYCRTTINSDINMYPESWDLPKLKLSRQIYQINNGAAGAPYYAQQQTPWSNMVEGFTTQNALVLIDIKGESVNLRVLNPETFELIDKLNITEK